MERKEGGTAWPQFLPLPVDLHNIRPTVEVRSYGKDEESFSESLGFAKLHQGPTGEMGHGEESVVLRPSAGNQTGAAPAERNLGAGVY